MPFGFSSSSEPPRSAEVDEVFEELCDRKERAFLVLPSLNNLALDTRFMERVRGPREGLLMRVAMPQAMAQSILQHKEIRLRFPWALGFHGALCRPLDYLKEEKRHMLLVSIPSQMARDDARKAYRLARVGHSVGAVGTTDLRSLVRVALEDISTTGAALFSMDALRGEGFKPGRSLKVDLSLDKGPKLETEAAIIHASGQMMGVCFQPALDGRRLKEVQEWMAPREAEDLHQWENRAALRVQAEMAAKPKAPPSGVLLITRDEGLAGAVSKAIQSIQELRWAPPVVAEVQKQLDPVPLLVLLHVPTVTLEERYQLRKFAKSLPSAVPVMVLATAEGDHSQALANELRAGAPLMWKPGTGNVLFQSVVQGFLRQQQRT